MIKHKCLPYCDGQPYAIRSNHHVIDFWVADQFPASLNVALSKQLTACEQHGIEVVRIWQEPDHKPLGQFYDIDGKLVEGKYTYTKNLPFLCLIRDMEAI